MAKAWKGTYYLLINYDGNQVDDVYNGKLNDMELHENSICYEIVATLLEYYGLKKNGVIMYVPPNGDPKIDIKVTCCEEDIKIIYEKQQGIYNIKLYVVPPFEDE